MAKSKSGTKGKSSKSGNLSHDVGSNLTDDQRQALFFSHLRKVDGLKTKMATASGELRAAYREAKADGFPKEDFEAAARFRKELENDTNESADRIRRQMEISRWFNHPLGTQLDMFDNFSGDDKRSQEERGFDEGKRAGLADEPCQPPFDPGTDGYDGYMKGWHEGNAVRVNMKDEQEQGENLLRRAPENEPSGPDSFDDAAEGAGAESETEPEPA